MPNEIDAEGLRALLDRGDVQLLEVLPEGEYEEEHLPGAVNVPLKSVNPESVDGLDRASPTVVYCWDAL